MSTLRQTIIRCMLGLVVVGVLSASSQAVPAPTYDLTTAWMNLQWPTSIVTDQVGQPTELIYGQIWVNNVTSVAGADSNLVAQVGYGPSGTMPYEASWSWFDAAYNQQVGNNDEYCGRVTPAAAGSFSYATRFMSQVTGPWFYGDLNGSYDNDIQLDQLGSLTVTPEPATLSLLALGGLALLQRRRK